MIRKLFGSIIILGLLAGAAFAADNQEQKSSSGLMNWLSSLKKKITKVTTTKDAPSYSTGVAGVRGAKEDSSTKLYWRGKKGEEPVSEQEMAKFKAAIELAEKGDRDNSLKQLDDFMKQYPDSALIPDAKKTYDMVKAMPKEEPKAEQKSEPAVEQKPADTAAPKAEGKEEKDEQK